MSNNYLHSDVAHSYEQVPKHVVSLLGYPLIIQSLQIASDQPRHLLDYGCGTGSFFSQIELAEPILKNLQEPDLVALETLIGPCQDLTEWDTPPYLILQALKPEL